MNVIVGDKTSPVLDILKLPTISNTNDLQVSATFNLLNEINSMVHIVNDLNLNLVKSKLAPDSPGEPNT